jgi:hypothetical protein
MRGTLEALNLATHSSFVRQERAKRMGHEGEARLARALQRRGIAFEPPAKAENPLSGDVKLNGVSFDVVVPGVQSPEVCVKSTVHTANIGQYGQSKDFLEIQVARKMLDAEYPEARRPILLALVDGVGFRSNAAGLDGVLVEADEFCQFKTLWKALVVCCRRLEKPLHLLLSADEQSRQRGFLARYAFGGLLVSPLTGPPPQGAWAAGSAWIVA